MAIDGFGFLGPVNSNSGNGTVATVALPTGLQEGDGIWVALAKENSVGDKASTFGDLRDTGLADNPGVFTRTISDSSTAGARFYVWIATYTKQVAFEGLFSPLEWESSGAATQWYMYSARVQNVGARNTVLGSAEAISISDLSSQTTHNFDFDLNFYEERFMGTAVVFRDNAHNPGDTVAISATTTAPLFTTPAVSDSILGAFQFCITERSSLTEPCDMTVTYSPASQLRGERTRSKPNPAFLTNRVDSTFSTSSYVTSVDVPYAFGTLYAMLLAEPIGGNYSGPLSDYPRVSHLILPNPSLTNSNAPIVQEQSLPITSIGTKSITWTGLSTDYYYHAYLQLNVLDTNGTEVGYLNTSLYDNPVSSDGGALGNDCAAYVYHEEISGTSTSFTINPAANGASAGDTIICVVSVEDVSSNTVTYSDPDAIIQLSTDLGSDIRAQYLRFKYLDNGNYNTVTFTFPVGSSQYTGAWYIMKGYSTSNEGFLDSSGSSAEPESNDFINSGSNDRAHALHFATYYSTGAGPLVSFRLDNYEEPDEPFSFSPGIVAGTTDSYVYSRFNWTTVWPLWELSYGNTNTRRYLEVSYNPEPPTITNFTIAAGDWDRQTFTFDCSGSVGHIHASAFKVEKTGTITSEKYYNYYDDLEDGVNVPRTKQSLTRATTQTVELTGLLEKQEYFIYIAVRQYARPTSLVTDFGYYIAGFANITTPDGPNEIVTAITEALAVSTNACTVTQVYNPLTIISVIPDQWQDELADVAVTTSTVTSHRFSRCWVKDVEQLVYDQTKTGFKLKAVQKDLLLDTDYQLRITDYTQGGQNTLADTVFYDDDPFYSNVILYFDYLDYADGEFVININNLYITATSPPTQLTSDGQLAFDPLGSLTPRYWDNNTYQYRGVAPTNGNQTAPVFDFLNRSLADDFSTNQSLELSLPSTWCLEMMVYIDPVSAQIYPTGNDAKVSLICTLQRAQPFPLTYVGFQLLLEQSTLGALYRKVRLVYRSQTDIDSQTTVDAPDTLDYAAPVGQWLNVAISYFSDNTMNVWINGKLVLSYSATNALRGSGYDAVCTQRNTQGGTFGEVIFALNTVRLTEGVDRYAKDTDYISKPWHPYPRTLGVDY